MSQKRLMASGFFIKACFFESIPDRFKSEAGLIRPVLVVSTTGIIF